MKMTFISTIFSCVGLLMVATGCGSPMQGAGIVSGQSANSSGRLPIVYYAKNCVCPSGGNCGAVRGATPSSDSGSSVFACKNLPGTTTTTGTSQ